MNVCHMSNKDTFSSKAHITKMAYKLAFTTVDRAYMTSQISTSCKAMHSLSSTIRPFTLVRFTLEMNCVDMIV